MIRLTASQYQEADDECSGFCVSCKEQQWGVEPDAHHYQCEACGERQVFGTAELLLRGKLYIVESGDEDDY